MGEIIEMARETGGVKREKRSAASVSYLRYLGTYYPHSGAERGVAAASRVCRDRPELSPPDNLHIRDKQTTAVESLTLDD